MHRANEQLDNALLSISATESKIIKAQPVAGGINSSVYKLTNEDNHNYALKLYPETTNGEKKRIETETNFLDFLIKAGVKECPMVVDKSQTYNWCLFNWISGNKVETITTLHIKQIASFTNQINRYRYHSISESINHAAEPCISLDGFLRGISEKYRCALKSHWRKESSTHIVNWLINNLEPQLTKSMQILGDKYELAHWQDLEIGSWISPSDVGIHNMIEDQGKIYFLDFEYAGKDDLSKLAADWVLQPNAPFNNTQENLLITLLNQSFNSKIQINDSWVERFNDIKPLIQIKWCIIMIKDKNCAEANENQFQKMKNYFSLTIDRVN